LFKGIGSENIEQPWRIEIYEKDEKSLKD